MDSLKTQKLTKVSYNFVFYLAILKNDILILNILFNQNVSESM